MTRTEIAALICELKKVFDVVRLVDGSMTTQYSVRQTGEMIPEPYECYAVWNRNRRCENCISAKAFIGKCKMTKFEFIEHDVHFVVSQYVTVEDTPYVLEIVEKVSDQTLFGAYGRNDFVDAINAYNQKLYLDVLTGSYNRQYYNEQLCGLPQINAVAMVDVDNFKQINDSYGHPAGDIVLQEVVKAIRLCIGSSDAVIRFGGDEFVLTFQQASEQTLCEKLEAVRKAVGQIRIEEHPALRTTISIGAVYCAGKACDQLREADKALYLAKKEKDRIKVNII